MRLASKPERSPMKSKILFISEALSAPFDEGIKNVTFSLYTQLKKKRDVLTVTNIENKIDDRNIVKINLNKLFLSNKLRKLIRNYSPTVILYLPESSLTFASFLRAKVLKLMSRFSKVVVFGVQHREYSFVQDFVLKKILKPDLLLILGKSYERSFNERGMRVSVLPPAVDSKKFHAVSKEEKEKIRTEYNLPIDKLLVLHVGHIKVNRNIECLIEVQRIDYVQVVIVGSTSIVVEGKIKDILIKEGIMVIDEVISDISKIYKMSDVYVFPVVDNTEAIDMPLSVLEAMSCNLPVISTRFGALVDYFKEDESFKCFNTKDELLELVRHVTHRKATNSKKIEQFTWSRFADTVISASENTI